MPRILDDYGRPGLMLGDTGSIEAEWELEAVRLECNFNPDFPPFDCNIETMYKKRLYQDCPGENLGDKMSAFYDSIPQQRELVEMECQVCHRKWKYRWYWHTCPRCFVGAMPALQNGQ